MSSFSRYFKRTPFSELAKNIGIVLLALFALSIIYENVISPLINTNTQDGLVDTEVPFDAMDGSVDGEQMGGTHLVKNVKTSQLFWKENLQRDPFLRVILSNDALKQDIKVSKQGNTISKTNNGVEIGIKPRLSGIIKGIDSNFAILDGQIMEVGDSIRGFKLELIRKKSIVLKKQTRTITIKLDDGENNV